MKLICGVEEFSIVISETVKITQLLYKNVSNSYFFLVNAAFCFSLTKSSGEGVEKSN